MSPNTEHETAQAQTPPRSVRRSPGCGNARATHDLPAAMRAGSACLLVAPVRVGGLVGSSDGLLARLWLAAGLLAVGMLGFVGVRLWDRRRLAATGSWWELRFGEAVSRAALEAFLRTLAAGFPRRLVGAAPWVVLSVSALEDRAVCRLFVSGGLSSAQIRVALEQAVGGITVEAPGSPVAVVAGGMRSRAAGLAAVGSRFLPLRVAHGVDPAGQFLAALRAQEAGEGGVVQLVLQAAPRSARRRARAEAAGLRAGRGLRPSASLRVLEGVAALLAGMFDALTPGSPHPVGRLPSPGPVDPFSLERARAIEAKACTPLLAATIRVAAWAHGRRRAGGRLGGLLAAFGQYQELGGLRRAWEPLCARRLQRGLPSLRPRLLLSSAEAASLIVVPQESALAPLSFAQAPSRSIAPVAEAPSRGLLLGRSDHSGFDREVRVEPNALLQHMHVLGPTGRGKSTLLLNLTLEAITAGMGGIVLDPTGELTGLILARIPQGRQGDVDLLDLGDEDHPPALNLLACAPQDGDVQVQAICGIFAKLFARFWGPRTEDILRSALATLLCGRDPAGPTPTLADVLTFAVGSG
jgi:hypothetical protein